MFWIDNAWHAGRGQLVPRARIWHHLWGSSCPVPEPPSDPPAPGAVPGAAPGATAAPGALLPSITSWRLTQPARPARAAGLTAGRHRRLHRAVPRGPDVPCSPALEPSATFVLTRVCLGGTVNGECRRGLALRCSTPVHSEFVVIQFAVLVLIPLSYSSEQLLMVPTIFRQYRESKNEVYLKGDVIWICQRCCLWKKPACFPVILNIKIPGFLSFEFLMFETFAWY